MRHDPRAGTNGPALAPAVKQAPRRWRARSVGASVRAEISCTRAVGRDSSRGSDLRRTRHVAYRGNAHGAAARGTSMIACSGHATTHKPQARHASLLGVSAVFRPWTSDLSFAPSESCAKSSELMTPSANTSYGHTSIQSALPSHRARFTRGEKVPGEASHRSPGRSGWEAARLTLAGFLFGCFMLSPLAELRAREWRCRSPLRQIHPDWLHCDSVTYQQAAPSSRLADRARCEIADTARSLAKKLGWHR